MTWSLAETLTQGDRFGSDLKNCCAVSQYTIVQDSTVRCLSEKEIFWQEYKFDYFEGLNMPPSSK
jgi:hypothetical protein